MKYSFLTLLVLIAFMFSGLSASSQQKNESHIQKMEKVMRVVAGITFLLTGIYYLNIYLKIV